MRFYRLLFSLIFLLQSLFLSSCRKLDDYEGNNQQFELTKFQFEEIISLNIDNDLLDFQGIGNCTSLPFGITINYEAFIPTENPNPHTHLVYNVKPKSIQLELVNIPDCDFSMLEDVKVYLVNNGTSGTINDFILQDPANPS